MGVLHYNGNLCTRCFDFRSGIGLNGLGPQNWQDAGQTELVANSEELARTDVVTTASFELTQDIGRPTPELAQKQGQFADQE